MMIWASTVTQRICKTYFLKKGKRNVQGKPQSQTAALPKHQEEEETDKKQTSTNRTNVRKALRLALSSPSEVTAFLKGLKTQEQNNTREEIKQRINHKATKSKTNAGTTALSLLVTTLSL